MMSSSSIITPQAGYQVLEIFWTPVKYYSFFLFFLSETAHIPAEVLALEPSHV